MSKSRLSFFFWYVFSLLLQTSCSKGTYWTLSCCVSNTKPCATALAQQERFVYAVSAETWPLHREMGPPPLQEEQDRAGALAAGSAVRSGQAGHGTHQCVKLCFQNVMSVLTTAPKHWASVSQLCSELQCCYLRMRLPKYRWKFTSGYVEDVFF